MKPAIFLLALATLACGVQAPVHRTVAESAMPTQVYRPIPIEGLRTYVVMADILNVRSGPGVGYPVVGNLYRDDLVVANCDLQERWCAVERRFNPEGLSWVFAPCIGAAEGECR